MKNLYIILVLILGVLACDNEGGESVWNPDRTQGIAPVITSVSPADSVIAGGEIVTIIGQNFSPVVANNYVNFGFGLAQIISVSPTELKVIAPAKAIPGKAPSANIKLKVGKFGVENWSNQVNYKLLAPFVSLQKKDFFDVNLNEIYGMTSDAQNNIYANLYAGGLSQGIRKFNMVDSTQTLWANSTFKFDDLVFNATDSKVYAVRGVRAIFRFAQNGAQELFVTEPTANTQFVTLEKAGNVWYAAGNNTRLFSYNGTAWNNTNFTADVRALKISGNNLFILAKQAGAWGLWKSDITGGTLGAPQIYTALPDILPTDNAFSLEVFTNGEMIVGTDQAPNPIFLVKADKSISPFYANVFTPSARAFAVAANSFLYMAKGIAGATDKGDLLKINVGARMTIR